MAKYLRRRAVCERYSLPPSTLHDWIAKGLFPRPVKLGPRNVAWDVDDLETWERARKADRPR
jgi:predicted DNA-binding transcriptional regulator AlpA